MSEFISVHLASDGERRKAALEQVAASVGAIGQRGPSISILNQMIADGELEVTVKTYEVVDTFNIDETTAFEIIETEVGRIARITYHTSGLQFTTTDWQGRQPESPDEIEDYEWMCTDGRVAIMMNGMPVLME